MLLISPAMKLEDLMDRMGPDATEAEAVKMREILVDGYPGRFAEDIPESRWFEALDQAFKSNATTSVHLTEIA